MKVLKQGLLDIARWCMRSLRKAQLLPPFCYWAPRRLSYTAKGTSFAVAWKSSSKSESSLLTEKSALTELEDYFERHREGPGIWKYRHYFSIYERHFRKFVGKEVHVLEVGIYSGGSLEMWRNYFGNEAIIYGVDIEESCRSYENSYTHIAIGDQADRTFWSSFSKRYPRIDIVIDDGGHRFEQQRVTFEAMFPHLQPGGVYLCEDLTGVKNPFVSYLHGFAGDLNTFNWNVADEVAVTPTALQTELSAVHFYPYVAVVEKRERLLKTIVAPKHGTQWQPFFDR
jgi:hypothetical protein